MKKKKQISKRKQKKLDKQDRRKAASVEKMANSVANSSVQLHRDARPRSVFSCKTRPERHCISKNKIVAAAILGPNPFKVTKETGTIKCWACDRISVLDRAHLVPYCLFDSSDPADVVLLCRCCHHECPDVLDRAAVERWIKLRRSEEEHQLFCYEWNLATLTDAELLGVARILKRKRLNWIAAECWTWVQGRASVHGGTISESTVEWVYAEFTKVLAEAGSTGAEKRKVPYPLTDEERDAIIQELKAELAKWKLGTDLA